MIMGPQPADCDSPFERVRNQNGMFYVPRNADLIKLAGDEAATRILTLSKMRAAARQEAGAPA